MHIAPEPLPSAQQPQPPLNVQSSFSFRHRGFLGAVLLAPVGLAVIFSPPTVAEDSLPGVLLNASGWLAFFTCVAVRIWATLYVGGRKDRELQTEGPYSICRNPLYVGSFAFAFAMACFLKSIVFGTALLFGILLYLQFVVRAEEHFLELRFQEGYRDYCRRTPRFWPSWSSFQTLPMISVELKRLKQEVKRLCRSAALIIALQVVLNFRGSESWPRWFSVW